MEYIIRGLSFLIISVVVSGVLALMRLPKKAVKGKVYLSKIFLIIGLIDAIFFLIPTLITAFSDEPVWIPIAFSAFSLLGAVLIIAFINCRITYDEDGFVAKNFFGIKRRFTYDQVTGIKENMHEDYIYLGKSKVMIDAFSIGGIEFIAFLHQKYRKLHDGKVMPRIKNTKHDIFNGNVEDAAGFIFVYILIGAVIIIFAVFIIWFIYFSHNAADNTIKQEVAFSSCEVNENEIVLISSDSQLYKIRFIGEGFNSEEIASLCDGETVVTTYSSEVTPDDEDDYFSIKAIFKDGAYILSFEETNDWHRKEYEPLIFIPLVFSVLWGAFVAGSIIVGRNPKKYSKKVIGIFFKDGYVRY